MSVHQSRSRRRSNLDEFVLQMSDDERLSLTTAISDEDEYESQRASPYRSKAASFNCTGAVRKAGFLSVKKWLLRRRHQVSFSVAPSRLSSHSTDRPPARKPTYPPTGNFTFA